VSDRDQQFRDFVTEHSAALLRLAYLLCADHAGAEDLVQNALVRVYVRWNRIETNPAAYVRRVLVTTAASEGRRAFRRRERMTAQPPDLSDRHDAFAQADDRDRLLNALRSLPPRQRAAVVLRHWLDLDAAESAAILGCSAETVRSQTARGLDKLRAALETATPTLGEMMT
jgi:RNA polymerase sigma-70 factor (sigma-E family)